jgi:NAD(P)-dependent dehydrogenase (short-subunit alcohol dehydrogenase family)
VREAFARAEAELGPIDLLVNNAAIFGPLEPFAESDPDAWWRAQEVNVFGPVLTCHAVPPSMIERKRGRIINIVTGAISVSYFSSYITSKSALIRFSECLALETKPHGIAVFPMGPGTVKTEMSQWAVNSDQGTKWIPWFKDIFDQGLDLPVERPAALAVALASGKYDALSGLNVWPFDDLDWMLAHREEIEREKLYTMKIASAESDELRRLVAIRDKGRRA